VFIPLPEHGNNESGVRGCSDRSVLPPTSISGLVACVYEERCPINYIEDKFDCPIILLQGDEDKVVPPGQDVDMYEALKRKGVPTCLVLYEGEQHGFRKEYNIRHALVSEYYFFCETFGIEPQTEEDVPAIELGSRIVV